MRVRRRQPDGPLDARRARFDAGGLQARGEPALQALELRPLDWVGLQRVRRGVFIVTQQRRSHRHGPKLLRYPLLEKSL